MYRIGVISDTHGKLYREVKEILGGCDVILHAGDIDTPGILEELRAVAPLYAVQGNADQGWAEELPQSLWIELQGLRIYLIHNKKEIREDVSDADVIICGHSHKYEERRTGAQIYLNPGSCGARRFSLPAAMALIEIGEDGAFRIIRRDIARPGKTPPQDAAKKSASDRAAMIRSVMKEIDKGVTVRDIAARHALSEEEAARICRMYVTHPGIDVDGILNRL